MTGVSTKEILELLKVGLGYTEQEIRRLPEISKTSLARATKYHAKYLAAIKKLEEADKPHVPVDPEKDFS